MPSDLIKKLQDAMLTHIRHDAAAGTLARCLFSAATCDNSTHQPTAHATSPNRERHVRSHLVDSRSQLRTIDRHALLPKTWGGKLGAPLIGQCHYLPWTWVADALSVVMPKEHVTSSTSTFLAKFLTGFESACEL